MPCIGFYLLKTLRIVFFGIMFATLGGTSNLCLMKKLSLFSLLILSIGFSFGFTTKSGDEIVGIWQNSSGKGHVQIFQRSGRYYGKIVWLRDAVDANGRPKVDRKNEDPALRTKPLIGLTMLRDFEYDNGEWSDGYIYNPSDGKEYKGYMKMKDPNTLDVRGYIGITLFGKTDTWTRVK